MENRKELILLLPPHSVSVELVFATTGYVFLELWHCRYFKTGAVTWWFNHSSFRVFENKSKASNYAQQLFTDVHRMITHVRIF